MNKEQKIFWDFIITKGIATSDRIRKRISIKESDFKNIISYSHNNPRDYFAYRILDEIQKAATRFIQWKDFFSSEGEILEHESSEQIYRITLQGVYDEVNLRVRKLTELATELILFKYTNEPIYYKDCLYFSEIISYTKDQSDRNEFYNYKSRNAEDYIIDLKSKIKYLEQDGLDVSKRWYLQKQETIDKIKNPKNSTFRDRYRKILSYKNADEITLIGKSYRHAYRESDYIHFTHDEKCYIFNEKSVLLKINKVAILIINILTRLNSLLGNVLGDEDKDLLDFSNDTSQKAYSEWTTSKTKPGDYVAIGKDLGIVLEENKSQYGFYSYKIKYLSDPPLPHIKEDTFAIFEISRFGNKIELANMIKNHFKQARTEINLDEILNLDEEFFHAKLVESFKEISVLRRNPYIHLKLYLSTSEP